MNEKSESGLLRWARRKAETQNETDKATTKRGAALPAAAIPAVDPVDPFAAEPTSQPPAAPETGATAAPAREAIPDHLPDVETLGYESDYSGFLSNDVSDAVRNIALRKLWRSNPLLANVDGLVDYDDDFTDAATVVEGMKTAYRIGRGMARDETEVAEETPVSTASEADASPQPETAEDDGARTQDTASAEQDPDAATGIAAPSQNTDDENDNDDKPAGNA